MKPFPVSYIAKITAWIIYVSKIENYATIEQLKLHGKSYFW